MRRTTDNPFLKTAGIFVVGIVCIGFFFAGPRTAAFTATADGVVVERETIGSSAYPNRVVFTVEGNTYTANTYTGGRYGSRYGWRGNVGDHVSVTYDPANPENNAVAGAADEVEWTRWFVGVFGLACAGFAVFYCWVDARLRRKRTRRPVERHDLAPRT